MVYEYRYQTPESEVVGHQDGPLIFLAGPTVGTHVPHLVSWRVEAIREFNRRGFHGGLVIPEFPDRPAENLGQSWIINWEFAALCASDVILFWIPRSRELIGLTTNWEHGYWMGRDRRKVVYGHPPDATAMTYLDRMWKLDAVGREGDEFPPCTLPVYETLPDTVNAAITLAAERAIPQ